jgi:MFS family permease
VAAVTTKQKLILTLLLGSQFMLSIDFSILNVALPSLGRDLKVGAAELPWVATAFALPSAGLSLLFGRLGDLLGRRRLFLAGLMLLPASCWLPGSPRAWPPRWRSPRRLGCSPQPSPRGRCASAPSA